MFLQRWRIIIGCRCNMERYYANMPLSDIVVCVQLHINYIYGFCTNVLNIYSFLDAYKQCILLCVL